MKKIIFAVIMAVSVSLPAKSQSWSAIPSGTICQLFSVSFCDNNTIYTTGSWGTDSSTFLKSVDAGLSFFHLSKPFLTSGHSIGKVLFINADTGFVCTSDNSTSMTYTSGAIYKTIDGTISWTPVVTGLSGAVTALNFADANTGYATVNGGFSTPVTVYKTSDGGISWAPIYTSSSVFRVNDLCLTDASTGYIVGQNASLEATILKIAGGTVSTASSFPAYNAFVSAHFFSATNGIASSFLGGTSPMHYILETADGGTSWSTVYASTTGVSHRIRFDGSGIGVALGSHLKSTDGGATWSTMDTTTFTGNGTPTDVACRNGVWIMVGEAGLIRRLGGITGIQKSEDQPRINIYPNPASRTAEINFGESITNGTLKVYDLTGRLLQSTPLNGNRTTVNVAHLPPGMYTLQVNVAEGIMTGKFQVK